MRSGFGRSRLSRAADGDMGSVGHRTGTAFSVLENKALANSRRSELIQAARCGEAFDTDTGLPVSELKQRDAVSFVEFAQSYMDMKWPNSAATTRAAPWRHWQRPVRPSCGMQSGGRMFGGCGGS